MSIISQTRSRLRAAAAGWKVGSPALFEYSTIDQYLYGPEDEIIRKQGVEAYITMFRTDAEIFNDITQAVLLALPDISVSPGGEEPEDKRNADIITAIISAMSGSDIEAFAIALENALLTGMTVAEPMLAYKDLPEIGRVIGMDTLATRPTRSFTEATQGIEVDPYGRIKLFRQAGEYGGGTVEPQQVVYFAHRGGPENRFGTSLLRPVYETWAAKIKVRRVAQVFMVTNASGIRHLSMNPEDYKDPVKRAAAKAAMKELSSLSSFVSNNDWKLDIEKPGSGTGGHFIQMLEYLNAEMRRGILGDSSFSSQEGAQGSLASRSVSQDNVRTAFCSVGRTFCDSVSEQLFPELLRLNGYTTGRIPKLKPSAIVTGEQARAEALYSLGELKKSGVLKRDLPEAAELAIMQSTLAPLDIQIEAFDETPPEPVPVAPVPPVPPVQEEAVEAAAPKHTHIHAVDSKRLARARADAKHMSGLIDTHSDDLAKTWKALEPQILDQLRKQLFESKPGGGWKTTDLTAIRQAITDTIRYKSSDIRNALAAGFTAADEAGKESAQAVLPIKASAVGWTPTMAKAALKNRVLFLLDGQYDLIGSRLYYAIENALVGNTSLVKTESAIRGILSSGNFSEAYAKTIMDTAMASAWNHGRELMFRELENPDGDGRTDIIGYEFVAVMDDFTTDQCSELNTIPFAVDDPSLPHPPLHYNCRSQLQPVFGNERDKFTFIDKDKSAETVARMQADGQIQKGFGGL